MYETSIATVAKSNRAGKKTIEFTLETAGQLQALGIDSAKYAKELSIKAAHATVDTAVISINGANDAIVVVINTGSGMVVASLDKLTAAVEIAAKKIENS